MSLGLTGFDVSLNGVPTDLSYIFQPLGNDAGTTTLTNYFTNLQGTISSAKDLNQIFLPLGTNPMASPTGFNYYDTNYKDLNQLFAGKVPFTTTGNPTVSYDINTHTYTIIFYNNGSITFNTTINNASLTLVGGGGGGGGGSGYSVVSNIAGNGTGGSYSSISTPYTFYTMSYNVIIGTGGTGGAGTGSGNQNGNSGNNGTETIFGGITLVSGGGGGAGGVTNNPNINANGATGLSPYNGNATNGTRHYSDSIPGIAGPYAGGGGGGGGGGTQDYTGYDNGNGGNGSIGVCVISFTYP
jgi:hypothetical protein